MLGADAGEDYTQLPFPLWASDKIDGIRCVTLDCPEGDGLCSPRTRSLKTIPNDWVYNKLKKFIPPFFDGELTCGNYQDTQSAIMTQIGFPDFTFHVFDYFRYPELGYLNRFRSITSGSPFELPNWVRLLTPKLIRNIDDLYEELGKAIDERGAEGLILRKEGGQYKYGRSTVREAGMLKIKLFVDSEAIVIGHKLLRRNLNVAERNELGYQRRPTNKEGMVEDTIVGSLNVRDIHDEREFWVGSGFNTGDRIEMREWADNGTLHGRYLKYKYQVHGQKDKPRIPTFLGWKSVDDM